MNGPGEGSGRDSPDSLPPLRDVIRTLGLTTKKSLGQNFILDLNLTRRIARAARDLAGRTVVEVGPGPGGLTRGLLLEGAGRVLAVERDERCAPALEAVARRYPGRLDVHMADALDADWPALLAAHGASAEPALIIANLPYGIATKLLIGWLETEPWPPWFDLMVLMFQKEVAERIVAQPGTKAYGRLAVISQCRTEPRIVLTLKPEAFTPPPKVASAVVEFVPRAAAFGQRRKMLRASLKRLTPLPERLLGDVGLAPELRGEQLTVEDFARLALALDRQRGSAA